MLEEVQAGAKSLLVRLVAPQSRDCGTKVEDRKCVDTELCQK